MHSNFMSRMFCSAGASLDYRHSGIKQTGATKVGGDFGAAPTRRTLVSMIVGTYREMPGLSLDLHQGAKLFDVTGLAEVDTKVWEPYWKPSTSAPSLEAISFRTSGD